MSNGKLKTIRKYQWNRICYNWNFILFLSINGIISITISLISFTRNFIYICTCISHFANLFRFRKEGFIVGKISVYISLIINQQFRITSKKETHTHTHFFTHNDPMRTIFFSFFIFLFFLFWINFKQESLKHTYDFRTQCERNMNMNIEQLNTNTYYYCLSLFHTSYQQKEILKEKEEQFLLFHCN